MRSGEISKTPTMAEKFRMEEGIEIGRRARELYPKGVLVDEKDLVLASEKTRSLMDDPKTSIIFEGTFLAGGLSAKSDILKRKKNGWHNIEVKSSLNDKNEFIDDIAYTSMVVNRCGFNISNASLLLISRDFRLGMKNENLFVEIDHTEEVLTRIEEFNSICEQIEKITREEIKPVAKIQFECRKCDIFKECLGKDIENHIFDIPRINQKKFDKLMELNIVCIEDIPDGFSLTENQAKVKDCVKLGKAFIGDMLQKELESISFPASYLDFETVMTAIPLYPDIAPYTQIPTQYSIHKCSEPGNITEHLEYFADPSKDCRRDLAEKLINNLRGKESIIVYSSFEKTITDSLIQLYPDLSKELNQLIDRFVDLEAIIGKNYCHPGFHGKTSIKIVLPTLVPEVSYDEMEIADGRSAMAAFAYLALGKYGKKEAESMKKYLLEYCKQDTLATVRLHQRLVEYAL